jgi:hypothetical protein
MKIEFQNAKATPVKHKDRMPECQNNTSETCKKNARMTKQHQLYMTNVVHGAADFTSNL